MKMSLLYCYIPEVLRTVILIATYSILFTYTQQKIIINLPLQVLNLVRPQPVHPIITHKLKYYIILHINE